MKDIEDCYYNHDSTDFLLAFLEETYCFQSYYELKKIEDADDYLATATDIYVFSSNRKSLKRIDESKTVLPSWIKPGMFVNIGVNSPYDSEYYEFALVVGIEDNYLRIISDLNGELVMSYDPVDSSCDINMKRLTKRIPINYITDIWRKDGKDETV